MAGIAPIQVRLIMERAVDTIRPSVLTQRRLMENGAGVAPATGHAPFPDNPVSGRHRRAIHVTPGSAHIYHAPDAFMPQYDRQWSTRVFAAPHVYVGATHTSRKDLHKKLPRAKHWGSDLS